MPLRRLEKTYIQSQIQDLGFGAFSEPGLFDDVEDAEFHAKLKAYLEIRRELAEYVGEVLP